MSVFRIPDLTDPKNEVVQLAGVVAAVLGVFVTVLSDADFSTLEGVLAAVSVLLANFASTQVSSAKTVASLQNP
jgi:hypothetical protein|tara:strand:+ start:1793 stop:2014 length:222 start_codon:yes stop_codon:yes gene_type:complete